MQKNRYITWLLNKGAIVGLLLLALVVAVFELGGKIVKPEVIRRMSESIGAEVEVGSVDIDRGFSLRLNDVVIRLESGELFKAGQIDLEIVPSSLMSFRFNVERVWVEDFHLHVSYDGASGVWNFQELEFVRASGKSGKLPMVCLENGDVTISTDSKSKDDDIVLRIEGDMTPTPSHDNIYGFYICTTDDSDLPGSELRGTWHFEDRSEVRLSRGVIRAGNRDILGNNWSVSDMEGRLSYDEDDISIEKLSFRLGESAGVLLSGSVSDYKSKPNYDMRLVMTDCTISERPMANALVYGGQVMQFLPEKLRGFLSNYHPVGFGDVDVRFMGVGGADYNGLAKCKDIKVVYDGFAYSLEHIRGDIHFGSDGVVLKDLQCVHGDVDLTVGGYSKGSGDQSEYDFKISSENMEFDKDLYNALGDRQKQLWWAFSPHGKAGIVEHMWRRGGGKDEKLLKIDLVDATATYEHFPYQLDKVTGHVEITDGDVRLENLTTNYADGQRKVVLGGEVTGTDTEEPVFNIVVDATSIPIDSKLIAALPHSQRNFYERFDVDALTDVRIKVFPHLEGKRSVDYIADVAIRDASITYDRFPIPLSEVNVEATLTADKIILHHMTGVNGDGVIEVSGNVWPSDKKDEKSVLCLSINGRNIELEQGWLEKIEGDWMEIVSRARPTGKINISAVISTDSSNPECEGSGVVIDCLGNGLFHEKYPYPLEGITGKIIYSRDGIEFKDLSGKVSGSGEGNYVRLDGKWLTPGGNFMGGEFSLSGAGIELDENITAALPEKVRAVYGGLGTAGVVDFTVDMLRINSIEGGDRRVEAVGEVVSKGSSAGRGLNFNDVYGRIDFDTVYDIAGGLQKFGGKYAAESFKLKGVQLTGLAGAIEFDKEASVFRSNEFTARIGDGRLLGNAEVRVGDVESPAYALELLVNDVELSKVLLGNAESEGMINGELNLAGGDGENRDGRLNFHVTDMKLAERSFMGKVLAAMQLNNPADYMFSKMAVESYVEGDELYFSDISMTGDSVAFKGAGTMSLADSSIDLDLSAYGNSVTANPSLFESLARGIGAAIVKVEVDGTTDEPKVNVTTLPVIRDSISILGEKR